MLDYLFNWMRMLDIVYGLFTGLWFMSCGNVINYVIIRKWLLYYSAAYECKESEKFIQVKNEWLIEKWSDVLMSRAKIHDPNDMGFGAR